jgi:hypothetical protein
MSDSFWRPSNEQRRTILLLEALGLIHDLGKLSNRFLQSQEPSPTTDYEHRLVADPRSLPLYTNRTPITNDAADTYLCEILNDAANKPSAFQERPDLTTVLQQVTFTDWTGQQYNFAELMPLVARPGLSHTTANWSGVLGRDMRPGLLVGGLHGPAHIEKEGEPSQHKQSYSHVFRATPFGLEKQVGTSSTFEELTDALSKLPLDDLIKIVTDQRSAWLAQMKMLMGRGLADNRRPHNEVSLWDWGYTVATMTKAAAAYIFRHGWPTNLNDVPYRTLRINLDILECYTRSDKISDILGMRQILNEAFRRVQVLLEETYTLGNSFYQDETGIYYVLPDIFDNKELAVLRREIQAHFAPDLRPRVYFGERITAGQLDGKSSAHDPTALRRLVADPRTQALSEASTQTDNNLYLFEAEWKEKEGRPTNAAICVACGMRPIGYPQNHSQPDIEQELAPWATQAKARRRSICRICLDRRGRRAEKWAQDGLQGTIWIDEVADVNGRLALLIGKLELRGWLDGTLLETIRVTSTTPKNPSPARLYRIVETARAFWEQMSDTFMPTVVGQHPYRLALYPEQNTAHNLGDFHAYELAANNVVLSVVWDNPNNRFLTVDNLSYVANQLGVDENNILNLLQGHSYEVREPSAFLSSGQVLGDLVIEQVERLDGYLPAIPLLAEPSVCLMLVPADKALDLIHKIKREYEQQMGRVRDRLPLHLGLIFFHRRTPVRTVLEAGRGMLQMSAGVEGWRLIGKNVFTTDCELIFDNGIAWRIPVVTGDGSIQDDWYPRMYEGDTYSQRQVKHVSDLRLRNSRMPLDRGWKVWVQPGRFDFEFLDTTARRFEIHYDDGRRASRPTRPFYLEDLDRLELLWRLLEQLERSQRYQVVATIEATRELWYGATSSQPDDEVFTQFVHDTLAGAAWPHRRRWDAAQHAWVDRANDDPQPAGWRSIPRDWQRQLIQAGVRGELVDLLELRMEILKER